MHDKTYLRRTIELFAAIIDQVHSALERGVMKLKDVQAAVDVDSIGLAYAPGEPLSEDFHPVVAAFAKKAMQEAHDGVTQEKRKSVTWPKPSCFCRFP
jgi:hypothetical protein